MPQRNPEANRHRRPVGPVPVISPAKMQAAAVCYRWNGGDVEFLLVTSRQGRWTFPKGNVPPGVSPEAAARLEAREEAGAIGIVHPQPVHTYLHCKRGRERDSMRAIAAHMLEVRRQRAPEEWFRQPTWFGAAVAKAMLARGREERWAHELHRVIDAAIDWLATNGRSIPRGA